MGASQKPPLLPVLFIKEFKNMGKHSKYSGYNLSFFELWMVVEGLLNELINGLIEQNVIKSS